MDEDGEETAPASRMWKGGRPTQEYARALSGNILEAALGVLIDRGYDDFTMSLVAERASVSKKTLYTRFESKDRLIAAVVHNTYERQIWESGRIRSADPVKIRLFECLCAILQSTLKPDIMAIEEVFSRKELQLEPEIRKTRMVPVSMVVELLEEAKRAGEADYDDPMTVAFMFFDTMVLGPRTRFRKMSEEEQRSRPANSDAATIFDLMWRGLTPRKP